jgi:hypothetical protein
MGKSKSSLKFETQQTQRKSNHGSGVRERFRGRGESPPTEEGGILRFRGIYVYLLFLFFFFVAWLLLLLLLLRALCVWIFEFNSCLSRFLCTLCGGFKRVQRKNSAAPLQYYRAEVLTNSFSFYVRIFIRRKPRARTRKVNRSKRSKRQTRRRRRRRNKIIRIRKTQTSSTIYPATKSTRQTSSPVDEPVDRRGRCLRNRCTPRRT